MKIMRLGEQSTAQAQAFVNLATKALRMTRAQLISVRWEGFTILCPNNCMIKSDSLQHYCSSRHEPSSTPLQSALCRHCQGAEIRNRTRSCHFSSRFKVWNQITVLAKVAIRHNLWKEHVVECQNLVSTTPHPCQYSFLESIRTAYRSDAKFALTSHHLRGNPKFSALAERSHHSCMITKCVTHVGWPDGILTYGVLFLSSSNQAFQHIYPDTCGKQVTEKNIGRKGGTNKTKSHDVHSYFNLGYLPLQFHETTCNTSWVGFLGITTSRCAWNSLRFV